METIQASQKFFSIEFRKDRELYIKFKAAFDIG
jgi:hypothetical protein